MVRLLLHLPVYATQLVNKFQSHNGAIAAYIAHESCKQLYEFQSHNGAIAAVEQRCGVTPIERFQSHNGAIAADRVGTNTPMW